MRRYFSLLHNDGISPLEELNGGLNKVPDQCIDC